MVKNKKRIQLICFTLISTILLILQPYELTFTNAASDNGVRTAISYCTGQQDSTIWASGKK